MQEAFRKAYDEAPAFSPSQHPGSPYVELLRAAVDAPKRPPWHGDPDSTRLIYRLEKLARHWCTYVQAGGTTAERRAELQDEWLPLAYRVAQAPPGYQVALLQRFAQPVIACPTGRQRRYLLRAAADHPQRFVGLAAVPGVSWLSSMALLVYSLEELEDCTAAECQELHHALAYEDPPPMSPGLVWLLERLAAWLRSRHPPLDADRSAA